MKKDNYLLVRVGYYIYICNPFEVKRNLSKN